MQAHPLSIPAALIPFQSSPSSQPASSSQPTPGLQRLLGSDPRPAAPPSAIPRSTLPGIAQGSGLAHDAGNLLGALGLYCDLLRSPGVLRPEHSHYATELGLISSRSSDLIRRLLALSPAHEPTPAAHTTSATPPHLNVYVDAGRLQPSDVRRGTSSPHEIPVSTPDHASVLRNLAPVLQRIAAGTATVSVTTPSVLPSADLSAEALERIAVNLVRNAVEAIRKQADATFGAPRNAGEIHVALTIVTDRLKLTVEDNGPGVPPPIAAAFLSPGVLPPSSHRGLGHRIVNELVTSSGGQISIRSRPGRGTLFCMKWPLHESVIASTEAHTPPESTRLTATLPGSDLDTAAQKGQA